jgi:hypothetical protein
VILTGHVIVRIVRHERLRLVGHASRMNRDLVGKPLDE